MEEMEYKKEPGTGDDPEQKKEPRTIIGRCPGYVAERKKPCGVVFYSDGTNSFVGEETRGHQGVVTTDENGFPKIFPTGQMRKTPFLMLCPQCKIYIIKDADFEEMKAIADKRKKERESQIQLAPADAKLPPPPGHRH